jgi:hypothetical protein
VRLFGLAGRRVFGPPARDRDHAGLYQVHAVEEPGELIGRAMGAGRFAVLVPVPDRRRHLLASDFEGGMVKREVAAGGHGLHEAAHDRIRLIVVHHVPQHAKHRDRDRLAEVQRPAGVSDDGSGIMHVCVDIVGGPLGRAGQQGPRMRQYQGIVVDVDDLALRRHALGDLMGVVRGRQAGPDIQELADPGLAGQVPDHPPEEQAVLPRLPHDVGEHLLDAITNLAVDGVIVLAAQPVIPDSRRMGHGRVDPGAGRGVRFARG